MSSEVPSVSQPRQTCWDWKSFSTREKLIGAVALSALVAFIVVLSLYLNAPSTVAPLAPELPEPVPTEVVPAELPSVPAEESTGNMPWWGYVAIIGGTILTSLPQLSNLSSGLSCKCRPALR